MKGHLVQRSPGSWSIKVDVGRDPATGKRVCQWRTVRGSKREAQAELARMLVAIDDGTHAPAGKQTVDEFLRSWIKGRHSVSPKTRERYGEHIEKHIIPHLGALPLKKLTTARLNQFYADLLDHGRLDGAGGLSAQTVRHIDRVLHVAFRDAVRQRLIAINPVQECERPKVERKAKRQLAGDELARLLAAAADGPLYAPLFTIFATGLRRGEVLALTWRNVDLDGGFLHVVATVEETRDGMRIKEPKTTSGRRRVDMPASLVGVLRVHRKRQQKIGLQLGAGWSPDALVFGRLDGSPQRPRNFTKAVIGLAKRAGLNGFSPHAGRHDHFTRLLSAGIHPKVAQLRAGHSSISVTLDVYSHATEGLQRQAAEQIDNVLAPHVANPVANG